MLVRHWIDLGRLSVRTFQGKVFIQGSLERIGGVEEQLTPAIVDTMFAELKRNRNILRLKIDLNNWSNATGKWLPVGMQRETDGRAADRRSQDSRYDLDGGRRRAEPHE